jgi:predicted Zn-dependent protease with MMP-like domain
MTRRGDRTSLAGRLAGFVFSAAIVAGGILTLVLGFSQRDWLRLVQGIAVVGLGVFIVGGVIVVVLVRLGGWRYPESEDDFELVVRRAERMAGGGGYDEDFDSYDVPDFYDYAEDEPLDDPVDAAADAAFGALVRSVVEDLPMEFHRVLEHVAIVVSDGGGSVRTGRGRRGAYGLYQGDTVTQDYFHDRIVIFRDTLIRDFGHDPELLRRQVARTVRHELAHHLGWDEKGVRRLGL